MDLYARDSATLAQMRKEVLKLERELMQEKNKNKLLQEELENPLNVHRFYFYSFLVDFKHPSIVNNQ